LRDGLVVANDTVGEFGRSFCKDNISEHAANDEKSKIFADEKKKRAFYFNYSRLG